MIREKTGIYGRKLKKDGSSFSNFRKNKDLFYTKDQKYIKKEIQKIEYTLDKIKKIDENVKNGKFKDIRSKSIENLTNELNIFKELWEEENKLNQNEPHKKLKPSYKKRSKKQIKEMVLNYIVEFKKGSDFNTSITKEEVSRSLKIQEKFIEQVFMELNREGLLSKANHRIVHDYFRGYGSHWASDYYYIRGVIKDGKLVRKKEEN